MIKKTINYEDFNGERQTEEAYFNLTKAEIAELELGYKGGLSNHLKKITEDQDTAGLVGVMKDLILRSYGKKSDDGKRFIKSKEMSDEFSQTEAFSELFMELVSNEQSLASFINGIMPKGLVEQAKQLQSKN